MLKIIAAVAANGVIGRANSLPFNLKADREWFKKMTGSTPVVMGSRTFESLPEKVRPLPGRENVILTRNPNAESAIVTFALWWGEITRRSETEDMFVIGGAQLYKLALPLAQELYLTRVHAEVEGDTFFPELDMKDWELLSSEEHVEDGENEFAFTHEVYQRAPHVEPSPFIEMRNCRTDKQRAEMQKILETGKCPFCMENLKQWHDNPILWDGEYWVASMNDYPYPQTRVHLILILKHHATNAGEIPALAFTELGAIIKWAESTFQIEGGGLYMRFGDCLWTGGTIRHIHAHIAVKESLDGDPIKFHLGS